MYDTAADTLTISRLTGLISVDGFYSLTYSFLFGMSVWINFIGGVIAYRALPRQMFGALQHRTFPIFFMLSEVMSAILLVLWTLSHPEVALNWTNPLQEDVAQAWALTTVLLTQGLNDWVVGPLTSKTMFERHRLEKAEGKSYTDEGVSDEMKALTKRFGMLHGISSLLSLVAVIALAFHGLWLGNVGVNTY